VFLDAEDEEVTLVVTDRAGRPVEALEIAYLMRRPVYRAS